MTERRSRLLGVDCLKPFADPKEEDHMSNPRKSSKIGMTAVVAVGLLVLAAPARTAAPATEPPKSIVLRHGALADGSSWDSTMLR